MTHHVVEDSAALQLALPEPGHVGSAVLLRGPGQIGAAGECGAARPDDGAALRHGGRERLVLEIAVGDPGLLRELEDPLRFRDVAAERFLACDAAELALAARDRVRDLLEVLDAREVRTAHPKRIDRGVGHHLSQRAVGLRLPHVELPRHGRHVLSVLVVRAPHTQHVGISHALEREEMEPRIEPASDESDAESFPGHTRPPLLLPACH